MNYSVSQHLQTESFSVQLSELKFTRIFFEILQHQELKQLKEVRDSFIKGFL